MIITEWANVCVKLLQGPIYADEDGEIWRILIRNQMEVTKYFGQIGINVFVDVAEGYAFLEQLDDDEESIDTRKLIRRYPLSFEMSLLCVLLREQLENFDVSQNDSAVLIMAESEIRALLAIYFKEKVDQIKLYRELGRYLNQAVELTFLKEIQAVKTYGFNSAGHVAGEELNVDRQFEVRRILRAKIDVEFMTEFKTRLEDYVNAT